VRTSSPAELQAVASAGAGAAMLATSARAGRRRAAVLHVPAERSPHYARQSVQR